jgi:tetratricopeptide (TPR) repeat protein
VARRKLYAGAFRTFADRPAGPARRQPPPPRLDEPGYAQPLAVVMRAWLATQDGAVPADPAALVEHLVDVHEERHWSRVAAAQVPALAACQPLLRRVAALAALAGAEGPDEAAGLVALLGAPGGAGPEPRRLADWAAQLYPGTRFWNPPQPDVVADFLVATTLGHDRGVLRGALHERRADALVPPLQLLARAVPHYPDLATSVAGVLDAELASLCRLAVEQAVGGAGSGARRGSPMAAALAQLVRACPPEAAQLDTVLDDMPSSSEPDLAGLAVVLAEQAQRHHRAQATADPAGAGAALAVSLNNLSVRLADAGRHREALAAIEEAVGWFRQQAEAGGTDAGCHRPELAAACLNHSFRLTDVGAAEEAGAVARQAVAGYRGLVGTDGQRYRAELARSLDNLSHCSAALGQWEQAWAAAEEAVVQYRLVPEGATPGYLGELARLHLQHARRRKAAGRGPEAGDAAQEAVALYRRLAEPGRHPSAEHVRALNDLAELLAGVGRRDRAVAAAREAVALSRRLATTPDGDLSALAKSLSTLSAALAGVGRREEARAASHEAVEHYRSLASRQPSVHGPNLATALNGLAARLRDLDLRKQASAAQAEARSVAGSRRRRGPASR